MRRLPKGLVFVALALSAGCAAEPQLDRPSTADSAQARRLLVEAAERGPVRLELQGLPNALTPGQAEKLAAEGVSGISVVFASDAVSTSPRLVLVFDALPGTDRSPCAGMPASASTLPHRLVAAFCDGEREVASLSGKAGGSAQADTERLVWRTTSRLFPDDYADSYGLNLFGSRLRVGLGGSFGF